MYPRILSLIPSVCEAVALLDVDVTEEGDEIFGVEVGGRLEELGFELVVDTGTLDELSLVLLVDTMLLLEI